MYAIVRYCIEDEDSNPEMEILGATLNDLDAEEMLATQIENDFDGVDIYNKVFKLWEWDINDMMKDEELWEELEKYYFAYHIKICEL